MSAEWIYAAVLFILSFVFDLVPGAKQWWENLPKEAKRWGWLIGSIGAPVFLWVLACYARLTLFGFNYQCDQQGLMNMLTLGLATYFFSQVSHGVSKKTGKAY